MDVWMHMDLWYDIRWNAVVRFGMYCRCVCVCVCVGLWEIAEMVLIILSVSQQLKEQQDKY